MVIIATTIHLLILIVLNTVDQFAHYAGAGTFLMQMENVKIHVKPSIF